VKAAIVKLSTVKKHDRLDPGFYLGGEAGIRLRHARRAAAFAAKGVRRAKKEHSEELKRIDSMLQSGDIFPI